MAETIDRRYAVILFITRYLLLKAFSFLYNVIIIFICSISATFIFRGCIEREWKIAHRLARTSKAENLYDPSLYLFSYIRY